MGNLKAVLGPGAVHLCIDMQRLLRKEVRGRRHG